MSENEKARCSTCNKDVTFHHEKVRHGLQLFLTLITFGIWLPIWLAMTFRPTKICDECNEPIWS